jgi:PAS domain S-box-containing protein
MTTPPAPEGVDTLFRTMADGAPVLLWMSGTDGLCTFFNQTWLRFTGRSLEREIGSGWAEGVHPEDLQSCMDVYLSAFVERREFQMEYRLRRADGVFRWVLDQARPWFGPTGAFGGFIGSCVDVTDLREARETLTRSNVELERRVRARTSELERSNTELDQFASVASHDLQEPLRMVASYTQLLERRLEGRLDVECQEFMRQIVSGAERMRAMVNDLLRYSRVGRGGAGLEAIELGASLERVLANLRLAIEESGARVTRDPLPRVRADAAQMTQLLQNLVGNAIKFRADRAPEIHVSAERAGPDWVIRVRDNGIGVDPSQHERIFKIFQRLHPARAYPGTGMGLAICKKIVERHGGRVWVESEPGRGSVFTFTLSPAGENPRP